MTAKNWMQRYEHGLFAHWSKIAQVTLDEEPNRDLPFDPGLLRRVEEIEMSTRSMNALANESIVFLGHLVQKTESEMLLCPNFGRKSLDELKRLLAGMGLCFGMSVPGWPDEYSEDPLDPDTVVRQMLAALERCGDRLIREYRRAATENSRGNGPGGES